MVGEPTVSQTFDAGTFESEGDSYYKVVDEVQKLNKSMTASVAKGSLIANGVMGMLKMLDPIGVIAKMVKLLLAMLFLPLVPVLLPFLLNAGKGIAILVKWSGQLIQFLAGFFKWGFDSMIGAIAKVVDALGFHETAKSIEGWKDNSWVNTWITKVNETGVWMESFGQQMLDQISIVELNVERSREAQRQAIENAKIQNEQIKTTENEISVVKNATSGIESFGLMGVTAASIWEETMGNIMAGSQAFNNYMKELGNAFGFKSSGVLGSDFNERMTSDSENKNINFMGLPQTVREIMRYSGNTLWDAIKNDYVGEGGGTGNYYGGKYYGNDGESFNDASLLVTPSGVKSFNPGDTIVASKGGMSGGTTININISNPSLKNNSEIKALVAEISRNLQTSLRGRVNYGYNG